MTSIESARSSAYSEDIRWRMVCQTEALGHNYSEVARNLCVDQSTVCRTVSLFHETGRVTKRSYPKEKAHRKLTTPAELLILHLVCQTPGILLNEIQTSLLQILLVDVSISTICRFLYKSGFTRQKLKITALQRDEFLCQRYILDMSMYSPEMLIFVDETGADLRNTIRRK